MKLEAGKRYWNRDKSRIATVGATNDCIAVGWFDDAQSHGWQWYLDGSIYKDTTCKRDLVAEYHEPEKLKIWLCKHGTLKVATADKVPRQHGSTVIGSVWLIEGQWAEDSDKA